MWCENERTLRIEKRYEKHAGEEKVLWIQIFF